MNDGFGKGCGLIFGMAAAVIVVVVGLTLMGKVVEPCPSCSGTGNCALCRGTGQGVLFGDCLVCGGKKSCPNCKGVGWKTK